MGTSAEEISGLIRREYKEGFVTDIASDTLPPGLDETVIEKISAHKQEPQWMLDRRLKAYRNWQQMTLPEWAHIYYKPIEFQDISYFSAPKSSQEKLAKPG